jgi:hypothetical protein
LIHEFDPVLDSRWQALIQHDPRACVFHSPNWLRVLQRTYGYTPIGLTTNRPGETLTNAAVFAVVKSWMVSPRLVSLPFSDHVQPLFDSSAEFKELLDTLQRWRGNRRWKSIELRPQIEASPANSWSPFHEGQHFVIQSIDLRVGLDRLFGNLHTDSIRRKIRKAVKSQVKEEAGNNETLLGDFFRLHLKTRRRQSLPPPPIAWFRNILQIFGPQAKIRVAYKGGVPIGSIMTLRFKDKAVYKYGCTDKSFQNLGTMPFLLWNAIEEEHATGASEFDLGRSEVANEGLIAFKAKFGAQCAPLTYRILPGKDYSIDGVDWKLALAKRIFGLLPEKSLEHIGRLIYPHIG